MYDLPELTGVNMRNGNWTDGHLMVRESLDKLTTTRPVYLFFNGYHSMICNTNGLERVGWTKERCPDGHLKEQDAFAAWGKLSKVEDHVMDKWIIDFAKNAA
jgi:predicted amidohydrolase YtcJ